MVAEAAATGTAAAEAVDTIAVVAAVVVAMTIAAAAAAAAGTKAVRLARAMQTQCAKDKLPQETKNVEHSARNPDSTPSVWLVLLDEGLLVGLAGPAPGGYGRCRLVRPLGLLHIPPEDQHEQPCTPHFHQPQSAHLSL